jgi:hypothetical protein
MTSHAYKFQAFVTLVPRQPDQAGIGDSSSVPGESPESGGTSASSALPRGEIQRMTVRGENHNTHGTQFFNAIVSNYGECADWIGADHAVVTIRLQGDDPADYFSAGDHFSLWRGRDIADGIVTRRLII